ncbi:MAG: NAD(+) synthase [Spirochaetia bacterium]|jgi:NAD+ synthase (glutamine-hydrolysing)
MPEVKDLAAHGFVRTAVASPELRVADVQFNVGRIIEQLHQAATTGCSLVVFPELCVTGYSCADLFYQRALLCQAAESLSVLADAANRVGIAAVVGFPLAIDGRRYNCAGLVVGGSAGGRIAGVIPKTYLPSTNEYYEERWFTSGRHASFDSVVLSGESVAFGTDLLFHTTNTPGYTLGIEICEDLWAPEPPSGGYAVAGATVIANPSASDELLLKSEYRKELVKQQSARCNAAYLYAGAGPNESTTDVVFGGHSLICENGIVLLEAQRFSFESKLEYADIDVEHLQNERLKNSSFSSAPIRKYRTIEMGLPAPCGAVVPGAILRRPLSRTPFVPGDEGNRDRNCKEIFAIQSTGLARRLRHTGAKTVVIGISGGLDSTLALLIARKAFDILQLPSRGILAVTMPAFGTTTRTLGNAERLMKQLQTTAMNIPIHEAVRVHFKGIGVDAADHDTTYENSQARERTQILMDLANKRGGLVVGTGDLSELAMGWSTFNGDHISMYNVNGGVPKTLVRYLIEWVAKAEYSGETSAVLRDVCATPISPELLPPQSTGELSQKTESLIGPYELHDFFLYHVIRCQFRPRKVAFLAQRAFEGTYSAEEIDHWLSTFYRRFFGNQFKRSTLPDGPKVGSVALSPRGDWRMPSDASSRLWLSDLESAKTDQATEK